VYQECIGCFKQLRHSHVELGRVDVVYRMACRERCCWLCQGEQVSRQPACALCTTYGADSGCVPATVSVTVVLHHSVLGCTVVTPRCHRCFQLGRSSLYFLT
jgi:hypothetical protein